MVLFVQLIDLNEHPEHRIVESLSWELFLYSQMDFGDI